MTAECLSVQQDSNTVFKDLLISKLSDLMRLFGGALLKVDVLERSASEKIKTRSVKHSSCKTEKLN